MKILVTGGAGYIGTHTCVELLNKGEEIVVLDNFSNSNPSAIEAVEKITGKLTDEEKALRKQQRETEFDYKQKMEKN